MNLYLDIETLPTTDEQAIAVIAGKIKPPANYKKDDTIAEWERDSKPALVDEAVAKTSFDGLFGRIACICYAFDDEETVYSSHDSDEKALLEHFYSHVFDRCAIPMHGGLEHRDLIIVGHNVAGFDLPFLKHRSIINGVRPIVQLANAFKAKPWDGCIADTMLMWSADREKRASLDALCRAFGIPGKGGFDGSMVASTWPTDPQKVIDYCKDDVLRARAVYKRLTFAEAA